MGATSPFFYFVSHSDPGLLDAVSRGRRAEHEDFVAAAAPGGRGEKGAFADPSAAATFEACRLDWSEMNGRAHAQLLALHRTLLSLRREHPSLGNCRRDLTTAVVDEALRSLILLREDPGGERTACLFNLSDAAALLSPAFAPGRHRRLLSTGEERFGGDGRRLPPESIEVAAGRPPVVELAPWTAVIYLQAAA